MTAVLVTMATNAAYGAFLGGTIGAAEQYQVYGRYVNTEAPMKTLIVMGLALGILATFCQPTIVIGAILGAIIHPIRHPSTRTDFHNKWEDFANYRLSGMVAGAVAGAIFCWAAPAYLVPWLP